MGGNAFLQAAAPGEPTLKTPRMSPKEYAHLKDTYLQKLRDYFPACEVFCPISAPEKPDYGDLDFTISTDTEIDFLKLAQTLGASGLIHHSPRKCTLGVPKDGSPSSKPTVIYKHCNLGSNRKPSSTLTHEDYAQIDISLTPPHLSHWHAFYASYGDIAGLLGHIIRDAGFTLSDTGLWLRLEELDEIRRARITDVADRDGRLLLSQHPDQVMRFLGLSVERYDAGFETLEELYEWLGQCRMLGTITARREDNSREDARARNKEKRTVFQGFLNEWLPAHVPPTPPSQDRSSATSSEGTSTTTYPSRDLDIKREQYLHEALEFFDNRAEFDILHATLMRIMNNAIAANLLKPILAKHSLKKDKPLNELLRAFRRNVAVDEKDGRLSMVGEPHEDAASELYKLLAQDGRSLRDEWAVDGWVREHWEDVRGLERRRVKGDGWGLGGDGR